MTSLHLCLPPASPHFLLMTCLSTVQFRHQLTTGCYSRKLLPSLYGSPVTILHSTVTNAATWWLPNKRSRSIAPPNLYIDSNATLPHVKSVKYLGIQLLSDLSWSSHISNICSKSSKLIGLMYRRFYLCTPEVALKLYKTFVRPHLEYASVAWDPHLIKDTRSLEQTQKFALRTCFWDWTCSYEELLARAQLSTLAERRKCAKLCHPLKVIHGLTDCPIQVKSPTYNTRQVSNLSLES